MAADYVFKIIIVGEPGVGKSCLLRRFADQSFTENYINTIGVDFKVRTLEIGGKIVKLNIWDSAGQERFRTIVNTYYRGAHGICVVYDITDTDSFEKLGSWLRDVTDLAEPLAQKLIVGTKVDLNQKRKVPLDMVQSYSDLKNIPFVETSSKTGHNVEAAFTELTKKLLEQHVGEIIDENNDALRLGNASSVGEQNQKKQKKCCS